VKSLTDYKKNLKRFQNRLILNNYYTSKIKRGKNLYAALLDWVFMTLVISLVVYIASYRISGSLVISSLLAALFASFSLALLYWNNRRKKNKKIAEINEEIAHKWIINEISKYDNNDFLLWVKEILEIYYNTSFHLHAKFIDLIGEIDGEIYAVKCFKCPEDVKVTLKDLENFMMEVKELNIKEAIIITTSYFSDEVKERLNYILMDFERLKMIMKEIGQYPTRADIEDQIISDYKYKKDNMKKVLINRSKERIFKFLISGLVIYTYSLFVPYKTYYRIIAFVSIGVGSVLAILNILKYIEGTESKFKEQR
jgi:phosphate/sulfate permease